MAGRLPNLFQPIQVGPFTLKNRIAVSPHGPRYADRGLLTDAYVAYEAEKAKGGAGLIIMSYGLSDPMADEGSLVSTWRKENLPFFRRLVAAVHEHDCRIFFQFGEAAFHTGLAPSHTPHTGQSSVTAREMTTADIRRMMACYAACAETLMEGGLDGVELHGHGDLFSDFLSPLLNRREDDYGGPLANRMRFLLEAIDVVRSVVGRDKALGARLSVDDKIPGSIPLEEGVRIAEALAATGQLDYLNIDTAYEQQLLSQIIAPMYAEQGHQLYASAAVKQVVSSIPVFGVGRIVDPLFAEQALAEGKADVITMARALIADPEWPAKARDGRLEDIRPCLGDNQECIGRVMSGLPMRCTVNPAAGREAEWGIGTLAPAATPRRVLVVGGGPAGMEAARTAALRGHQVRLYEASDSLGGQVLLAERLPGRADIGKIVPWLRRQLAALGVEVVLNREVTPEQIAAEAPEAVVIATGARWLKTGFSSWDFSSLQGWEQAHVVAVDAVVSGEAAVGRRVIIYDTKGFVEAPGVAELLADQGREVEIVTPFPSLGTGELKVTFQWDHVMPRLLTRGVGIRADAAVEAVDRTTVTLRNVHTGVRSQVLAVDTVVVIGGREPRDELYQRLARAAPGELHRIGDCARPVNIGHAMLGGHTVGMQL